jgi:hypothetical protein
VSVLRKNKSNSFYLGNDDSHLFEPAPDVVDFVNDIQTGNNNNNNNIIVMFFSVTNSTGSLFFLSFVLFFLKSTSFNDSDIRKILND